MLDLDFTLVKDHDKYNCIPFDAYLPSNNRLQAYFRPGTFEFFRRLAKQNVKFGFLTNRSGPYGHSVIDLIRYALAQGCSKCTNSIGPVHPYYASMIDKVSEKKPQNEAAFNVPAVTACAGCDCGVAAIPELDDQLERRVRCYSSEIMVSKRLTEMFPDRDDWERAILIDDDEKIVGENLGHAINALANFHPSAEFDFGLLHRILPIVERCVEVTREHRQRLEAKLKERRAEALKQEQDELAKNFSGWSEDQIKLAKERHLSESQIKDIERKLQSDDILALSPRWSDLFQARIAARPRKIKYSCNKCKMPAKRNDDKEEETVHDLWSNDPMCKTTLNESYGAQGYQELLNGVQGKVHLYMLDVVSHKLACKCEVEVSYPTDRQAMPKGYYKTQLKQSKAGFWINKDA